MSVSSVKNRNGTSDKTLKHYFVASIKACALLVIFVLTLTQIQINLHKKHLEAKVMPASSDESSLLLGSLSEFSKNKDFPVQYEQKIGEEEQNDFSNLTKILDVGKDDDDFIILQIFNSAFVDMTKSFLCNIIALPNHEDILKRLILVATDSPGAEKITDFIEENFRSFRIQVVLVNFDEDKELRFGHKTYFKFIKFRSALIKQVLLRKQSLLLTEADQWWIKNPIDSLKINDQSNFDIRVARNNPNKEAPNGGFMFLKGTANTLELWSDLDKRIEENYQSFGPRFTEQKILLELFQEAIENRKINVDWFPSTDVVPGTWFHTHKPSAGTKSASVVFNNFLIGNQKKKLRAQRYGFWFTDSLNQRCVNRK